MVFRFVLFLFAMAIISGCGLNPSRMDIDSEPLLPEEAVFITKVHTNLDGRVKIRIHEIGAGFPITHITGITQPSTLSVIKLDLDSEETLAYVSKISAADSYARMKNSDKAFLIKRGYINYIGDFVINKKAYEGPDDSLRRNDVHGVIDAYFYDNEKETISEAKELYPELFKKHRYYSRYAKEE